MNTIYNTPPIVAGSCGQPSSPNVGKEWIRLPKPGCRLEGLSRTTLTELAVPCAANKFKPPILSVLIKKRGAARGIRLINRQSLYEYLQHLADEQAQETDGFGAKEVSK